MKKELCIEIIRMPESDFGVHYAKWLFSLKKIAWENSP